MAELSTLVKQYKKRLHYVGGASYTEASNRVVYRTPVDTGLLRRSWTPGINRFDNSNSGGSPSTVANNYTLGDALTNTNGQPYARVIEYTGHSPQAPLGRGMVTVTIAEWSQMVADAARRAASGV